MARDLYAETLAWLRYCRRYPLVCTETGQPWNSDVVGMTEDLFVEVEIKVSRADLLAEFRNKQGKHWYYDAAAKAESQRSSWSRYGVPNYFYVAVPKDLEKDALEVLAEKATWAGVLVNDELGAIDGRNIRVARRAKKLHDKPPLPSTLRAVQQRASSELCGLYIVRETYLRKLEAQGKILFENAIAAITRLEGYSPVQGDAPDGPDSTADQDTAAGQADPLSRRD